MRQRIIDQLPRDVSDSAALSPVRRERFLVYIMGPYKTFDVEALLPADHSRADEQLPSFATWDAASGQYAEDEVLQLMQRTQACLRERGFNAFLAIDVGIEIGSVLEAILSTAGMEGDAADATPPNRARRVMVAAEPDVRSAMLGAVHNRWDASVRTFTDATDLCRLCAQFCTHIQNEELYGDLDRLV